MSKKKKIKPNTSLVHAGRDKKFANGAVNIPPYRSSTVLFDTLDDGDVMLLDIDVIGGKLFIT